MTSCDFGLREMGFSDLSDLEETGSALTMSDDEDSALHKYGAV